MMKHGEHISAYMEEFGGEKHVPLTRDEELDIFSDPDMSDDERTEILVNKNIRLVISIAKKYSEHTELDELIQEGILGLHDAIGEFDVDRGVKFGTYAYWHIFNRIQKFMKREHKTVGTISNHKAVSMDNTYHKDASAWSDILRSQIEPTIQEPITNSYQRVQENDNNYIYSIMKDAMSTHLNEREQFVIQHRFTTDGKVTLKRIGRELNISHTMVKNIETTAFNKLASALKSQGITHSNLKI